MHRTLALLAVMAGALGAPAQQINSTNASIAFNGDPNALLGQGPVGATTFTESPFVVSIKGAPGFPVALLGGPLAVGSLVIAGVSVDLADLGNLYGNNLLFNGAAPATPVFTDAAGLLNVPGIVPACFGATASTCVLPSAFSFALQAVTTDPAKPPFFFNLTAALAVSFANGHVEYPLSGPGGISGDGFQPFVPFDNFTFKFYGTTYSQVFLTANAEVSLTPPSTGFPVPTAFDAAGGTPRIFCFYEDLTPEVATFSPRIFADQFVQDGVRKVRFTFDRLAEFGNATGPHGGEAVITETGDIAVFVAAYNAAPSINTIVGISPGNNVDPVSALPSIFGVDLSLLATTGPNPLGAGKSGFEVFDHGIVPTFNPINLAGFGAANGSDVGRGVVFRVDPNLPNTNPTNSGYVIE